MYAYTITYTHIYTYIYIDKSFLSLSSLFAREPSHTFFHTSTHRLSLSSFIFFPRSLSLSLLRVSLFLSLFLSYQTNPGGDSMRVSNIGEHVLFYKPQPYVYIHIHIHTYMHTYMRLYMVKCVRVGTIGEHVLFCKPQPYACIHVYTSKYI